MSAALRTTAYAGEHRSSVAARMAPEPKGYRQLLAWMLREWSDEVPGTVHVPGVWRDFVLATEDRSAVGGSLIGSPALHGGFRSYTENSPRQVDADGTTVRPIHRALTVMAGRTTSGRPFMARFLFQLACSGGDIETVGARWGLPAEMARDYAEAAMFRLHRTRYDPRTA